MMPPQFTLSLGVPSTQYQPRLGAMEAQYWEQPTQNAPEMRVLVRSSRPFGELVGALKVMRWEPTGHELFAPLHVNDWLVTA